ncbi:Uncharacterized protein TCM_043073 [Theobroma cacao]|uniref:Uncharacterized protein n=1 Tax=Theobroma cacao TaxID=3641 RepID=A0A061FPC7_THECC|nr:Uncharacterized protein TCM_043073 [Theobroma cacao]
MFESLTGFNNLLSRKMAMKFFKSYSVHHSDVMDRCNIWVLNNEGNWTKLLKRWTSCRT